MVLNTGYITVIYRSQIAKLSQYKSARGHRTVPQFSSITLSAGRYGSAVKATHRHLPITESLPCSDASDVTTPACLAHDPFTDAVCFAKFTNR